MNRIAHPMGTIVWLGSRSTKLKTKEKRLGYLKLELGIYLGFVIWYLELQPLFGRVQNTGQAMDPGIIPSINPLEHDRSPAPHPTVQ